MYHYPYYLPTACRAAALPSYSVRLRAARARKRRAQAWRSIGLACLYTLGLTVAFAGAAALGLLLAIATS